MQKYDALHQKILELFPQLNVIQEYLPLFVEYERPHYQRTLYEFWCKAIDKIIENIFKQSSLKIKEISDLFQHFPYQPLGLMKVLRQMHKEELIVLANNQSQVIQKGAQILMNTYTSDQAKQENMPIMIWDTVSSLFKLKTFSKKETTEQTPIFIIHIKYLKESIEIFKQSVEEISYNQYHAFTIQQLVDLQKLNKQEITFLMEIFQQAQLIESIGIYNINQIKQEVFAYKILWQLDANQIEINKNISLYRLHYHEAKLINEYDNLISQIESIEQKIRTKILQKKKAQDIKFEICFKKQYTRQSELIQNKLLVIQQNLFTLQTAESDLQIQDILNKVNSAISNFQVDPMDIKEGLDQQQDNKLAQEQINEMLVQHTNQDELQEIYAQYCMEMATEDTKQIEFVHLQKQQQQQQQQQTLEQQQPSQQKCLDYGMQQQFNEQQQKYKHQQNTQSEKHKQQLEQLL